MKGRIRRIAVAVPLALALSGATLVASNADDASAPSDAERSRKYAFMSKHFGYKYIARWNPCRTIHYKINPRKSPRKGAIKDVRKAIKRVHGASGLKFKYLGRTKVVPKNGANKYRGKTDLVIAWTTPKKRNFSGNAAWGGGQWWHRRGARYGEMRTGFVIVNGKYRYNYPKGFGANGKYGTRGQLLMHELGHAMGLWHVPSKKQLMYRYTRHRKAKWGGGDRKGLHKVGRRAGCGGFRAPDSAKGTDVKIETGSFSAA